MSAAPESFSAAPDTQAFLAGQHDLLIGGERVPALSGERIAVHDRVHVVPGDLLVTLLAKLFDQGLKALHASAFWRLHSGAEQITQRGFKIAGFEDGVGDLIEELAAVRRERLLSPVPP